MPKKPGSVVRQIFLFSVKLAIKLQGRQKIRVDRFSGNTAIFFFFFFFFFFFLGGGEGGL